MGLSGLTTLLDTFKVDSSVPTRRRERNARFRLDTLVNLQSLAEEYFAGEEYARARGLLEQETELVASLNKANLSDRTMRDQVDRTVKRLAFLGGRIRIRLEPQTPELISRVEETFNEARGLGAEQDCQIDLELGDLLLRSARLGVGTPVHLYDRAVDAFERAAGRTAPALHGDTIRALSAAYAMRDTIVRTAKANAGASSRAAK